MSTDADMSGVANITLGWLEGSSAMSPHAEAARNAEGERLIRPAVSA